MIRSGVQLTDLPSDQERARVDEDDVHRADQGGRGESPDEQGRAPDRADDERLEQAVLCVATDGAEGEKRGQHRPEEEGGEHGEPEHRAAGQLAVVHRSRPVRRPAEVLRLDHLKGFVRSQRIQAEEGSGEHDHDEEDPPAQVFAQRVADDDRDALHPAWSPTASR